MTNRERIAQSIEAHLDLEPGEASDAVDLLLADLQAAGLVIMPAEPNARLRHEAVKGTTGVTAAAFATMWGRVVAFARTQDR